MLVIDRTIGWGKREAHFTEEQLRAGDKIYCGIAGMSRATMFRVLRRLEDKDIIRRRAAPQNPRKVYYSVNMEWKPEMLNVPKRKRGKVSLTGGTTIVSPLRPSQSHPCDPSNCNQETVIETVNHLGAASPCPVSAPADDVRKKVSKASDAHRISATTQATDDVNAINSVAAEAAWRLALLETFPGAIHKPWSIREKAQVKAQMKTWPHNRETSFPAFGDWAVRNWSAIVAKQFRWMKESPPPAVPSLSFFLSFLGQFAECWGEGKLDEWLTATERTEHEKLVARGMSHEEAAAETGRRRAIERMREQNEQERAAAARDRRRAEAAERRILAIAEAKGVLPIHPESRKAKELRGQINPPIRVRDKPPEIDWGNQPTFDPNWEPPL
ncbi:MarR family transcriptional regulator [Sphingosinicella sp. LY1275]|uniref:MarR family transcriptional regulator n=1 Tax=Sphingosinicella sp. LY1275 TaxID=3095379 RepID=UPI002ADEE5A4|nr:MarR family transcriptional regulator [Sphingosinicella sp. LY1275]MEA1015033.1 MarR family transcriptional regulator [Sphingosinicella sp. LY1275]